MPRRPTNRSCLVDEAFMENVHEFHDTTNRSCLVDDVFIENVHAFPDGMSDDYDDYALLYDEGETQISVTSRMANCGPCLDAVTRNLRIHPLRNKPFVLYEERETRDDDVSRIETSFPAIVDVHREENCQGLDAIHPEFVLHHENGDANINTSRIAASNPFQNNVIEESSQELFPSTGEPVLLGDKEVEMGVNASRITAIAQGIVDAFKENLQRLTSLDGESTLLDEEGKAEVKMPRLATDSQFPDSPNENHEFILLDVNEETNVNMSRMTACNSSKEHAIEENLQELIPSTNEPVLIGDKEVVMGVNVSRMVAVAQGLIDAIEENLQRLTSVDSETPLLDEEGKVEVKIPRMATFDPFGDDTLEENRQEPADVNNKFVLCDEEGKTKETPLEAAINVWEEFRKTWHLFKVTLIVVAVGFTYVKLSNWNGIIALYIEFVLLLVQLVFAIDKSPGLRIDPECYRAGSSVSAILEDTDTIRGPFGINALHKKHYVVVFTVQKKDGDSTTIRKTLRPSIFESDLVNVEICETRFITDLIYREGMPFTAFPRNCLFRHITRQTRWILFGMPILVISCLAIVYTLIYTQQGLRHLYIKPTLIFFGVIYTIILCPLVYSARTWLLDVTNGGEEISKRQSIERRRASSCQSQSSRQRTTMSNKSPRSATTFCIGSVDTIFKIT